MNATKTESRSAVAGQVERSVRPQRWTAAVAAPAENGGFVAWGDYAELLRWKSTHAPRLAALEGLLHAAQHEAHAGREAIATLASERAANELLTNEVERLRAMLTIPVSECTHQCRKCLHRYVADGSNEDCPRCGHDGLEA